jgi:hypothetical protein
MGSWIALFQKTQANTMRRFLMPPPRERRAVVPIPQQFYVENQPATVFLLLVPAVAKAAGSALRIAEWIHQFVWMVESSRVTRAKSVLGMRERSLLAAITFVPLEPTAAIQAAGFALQRVAVALHWHVNPQKLGLAPMITIVSYSRTIAMAAIVLR